jgi:hypothetical protein
MADTDEVTPVGAHLHPDGMRRPQSFVRSRNRSTVVFCGEQVNAGFALALALMGAEGVSDHELETRFGTGLNPVWLPGDR